MNTNEEEVVRIISQLKTEIIERKWAEKKARDALGPVHHRPRYNILVVLDESRKVISANLST
ncbi:hypothetical protein MASR2M78_33070 [Treponema sp.]